MMRVKIKLKGRDSRWTDYKVKTMTAYDGASIIGPHVRFELSDGRWMTIYNGGDVWLQKSAVHTVMDKIGEIAGLSMTEFELFQDNPITASRNSEFADDVTEFCDANQGSN